MPKYNFSFIFTLVTFLTPTHKHSGVYFPILLSEVHSLLLFIKRTLTETKRAGSEFLNNIQQKTFYIFSLLRMERWWFALHWHLHAGRWTKSNKRTETHIILTLKTSCPFNYIKTNVISHKDLHIFEQKSESHVVLLWAQLNMPRGSKRLLSENWKFANIYIDLNSLVVNGGDQKTKICAKTSWWVFPSLKIWLSIKRELSFASVWFRLRRSGKSKSPVRCTKLHHHLRRDQLHFLKLHGHVVWIRPLKPRQELE